MKIKTIIKFLIYLIILFLLIFVVNRIYTTKIIMNVYSTLVEKSNQDNFYLKITNNSINQNSFIETFIKDGIHKKTFESHSNNTDNVNKLLFWQKNDPSKETNDCLFIIQQNENTPIAIIKSPKSQPEATNGYYKYAFAQSLVVGDGTLDFNSTTQQYDFISVLKICLRHPSIQVKSSTYNNVDCYEISALSHSYYISKATNLPIGAEVKISNTETSVIKYDYFTKDVTEEDLSKPDISGCTVVEE